MKFGQILAMRFDVLSVEYAVELMNLLNNASPVPNKEMFAVFEKEFNRDIKDVFESIEEKPLAVASFGQVYRAVYDGKNVVVKIQKPNVGTYIKADLMLLSFLGIFFDGFGLLKAVPIKDALNQLKFWLSDELDYTTEAHNNKIIYEHVGSHKLESVIIPKPFVELTSEKVLVQEFLEGSQVKRIISYLQTRLEDVGNTMRERNIDLLETSNLFIKDLMRQYFIDKFFHADPHPANLMIFPDSKIGYIDFGIIGRPVYDNMGLLKFIQGAVELDAYNASKHMVNFVSERIKEGSEGVIEGDPKIESMFETTIEFITEKFSEDLSPILQEWHFSTGDKSLSLDKRSSAVAFLKIIKALEKYKVKMPSDVIAFIRSLLIIDMVCLKLSEDFNMIEASKGFFAENSVEKINEKSIAHSEETKDIMEFEALRSFEISPEAEGALNVKSAEKHSVAKEKLTAFVGVLAEKYPELYNRIKEAKSELEQ